MACFDDLEEIQRRPAALEGLVKALQNQAVVLQEIRWQRSEMKSQLAHDLGLPAGASMAETSNLLPAHCQPHLKALMEENDKLHLRIEKRAAQSEELLASLHLKQTSFSTTPVFDRTCLVERLV